MKKNYLIILIALIISAFYYFVLRKKVSVFSGTQKIIDAKTGKTIKGGTSSSSSSSENSLFPLKYGSKGIEVRYWQSYLNLIHKKNLVPDGVWGPLTEKATKEAGFIFPTTGANPVYINQALYNSTVGKNLSKIKSYLGPGY